MLRHPLGEPVVVRVGVGGERRARDVAVALDVVARHDRRRRHAALAAPGECLGDQAEDVDLELVAPLLERQVLERAGPSDARVVDPGVDPAMARDRGLSQRLDLGEPAAREAMTAFMEKRRPDFSKC